MEIDAGYPGISDKALNFGKVPLGSLVVDHDHNKGCCRTVHVSRPGFRADAFDPSRLL